MEVKGYDWSGLHRDSRKDPFRLFLSFLSLLYGIGVQIRLLAYHLGIFRPRRLSAFVISIGNLTTGGTGKTPAVRTLATWALDQGYRPGVISRGYGGDFGGEVLVVSDGKEVKSLPGTSGDEPYFLAKILPHVPVIVSKVRYKGGLLACKNLGCNFLILDDGFQHLKLQRDLDIVLLDAGSPFGNRFCLPRGPLREPIGQLRRADGFVLTRFGRSEEKRENLHFLSERFPLVPVFLSDHIPARVIFPEKGSFKNLRDFEGSRVVAFAGIAHPDYFRATLEDLKVDLLSFEAFGDHHSYSSQDIKVLLARKESLGADYLLMTGKDWVKVQQTGVVTSDMGYVDIRFQLLEQEGVFFSMVRDAFEKKQVSVHGSRFTVQGSRLNL